jgi:5-methylcytosine-specific restriction endonuclease McrA
MIAAKCMQCGKDFQRPKRHYEKRKSQKKPKFCSLECGYQFRRLKRGKPPVLGGKCWAAASKEARERDEKKCCICGSFTSGIPKKKSMPVDHIIPRRLMQQWGMNAHDLSNLACLCCACHGKKTGVEWALFEGDVIGFVTGLRSINYPKNRVMTAFYFAEMSASLVDRIYR